MKQFFIIVFILSSFFTSAQEKVNQYNENGERIGVWKKYYANNRIRYIGQFENGKEVGVFKFYSVKSSTFPTAIKTFSKSSSIAEVQFFNEKGVLESEGKMNDKNRTGLWTYYFPDGKTVISEENYKNGLLNGEAKTFYKDGKITEILHYKNGKLHGNVKRYASNGTLIDDLNYKEGKLHGPAKYYNIEGKLIYAGDYENDLKVGKWEYHSDGKN
jgi:antitoxin component YwqK of YwqJK toxin-antitoxin module